MEGFKDVGQLWFRQAVEVGYNGIQFMDFVQFVVRVEEAEEPAAGPTPGSANAPGPAAPPEVPTGAAPLPTPAEAVPAAPAAPALPSKAKPKGRRPRGWGWRSKEK